jgi:Tub family
MPTRCPAANLQSALLQPLSVRTCTLHCQRCRPPQTRRTAVRSARCTVQDEASETAVAPHIGIAAPNAPPAPDAARGATPAHDTRLHALLASLDIRAFVGTPGPFLKPIQCYIVREKATGGFIKKAAHVYKLFVEEGGTFLLAAQRRPLTKAPSYLVSLDQRAVLRAGPSYYGKIKARLPTCSACTQTCCRALLPCAARGVVVPRQDQGAALSCSCYESRCFSAFWLDTVQP